MYKSLYKSPEEVITMVEGCTTEQLKELRKQCIGSNNLYTIMILLTIDHELKERKNKKRRKGNK